MAEIIITRNLKQQGGTLNGAQVSAFIQNSIKFTFDRGSEINTYAVVSINGNLFRATKILTVVTLDTYQIDVTCILPYILGFAPTTVTATGLVLTPTITIQGYTSVGIVLGAAVTHPTIYLSFGYPNIGVIGGLDGNSAGKNMSKVIYHNGKFSFSSLGGSSFYLGTGAYTGKYPDAGYDIDMIYKNIIGSEIAWLNSNGCWSYWNFRYLAEENIAKSITEIPVYASTNAEMYAKSVDISTEKKLSLYFDTIAVDDIHYKQLTEIAESARVIYSGKVYRIKDSSSRTANCRQNLKFNLTLEIEENAVSY